MALFWLTINSNLCTILVLKLKKELEMSKVSELYLDIELMLEQGDYPPAISRVLGVPVGMVYDVLEQMEPETDELSPFSTVNS